MTNSLATIDTPTSLATASTFMPLLTADDVLRRHAALLQYKDQVLQNGVDYGVIPGTGTKPTLLKPGAEKLCTLFGLTVRFAVAERVEDWTGSDHGGEAFFYYQYRCSLSRGDLLIAEGDGSANSWESKYRYRSAQRTCPNCGVPAIIKGKAEYGGGYICFEKKGGCKAKFAENDPAITSQAIGRVANPDIADVVNTLQKMAQKRALVAATLIGTNASDFFTQDIEDFPHGNMDTSEPAAASPERNAPPTAPAPRRPTAPPAPAKPAPVPVENFASAELLAATEAARIEAVRLGLRTKAGAEPAPAETNWAESAVLKRLDTYRNYITERAAATFAKVQEEVVEGEVVEYERFAEERLEEDPFAGIDEEPEHKIRIPKGTEESVCPKCRAKVFLVKTQTGGVITTNPEGTMHMSTCPQAGQPLHTRGQKAAAASSEPYAAKPVDTGLLAPAAQAPVRPNLLTAAQQRAAANAPAAPGMQDHVKALWATVTEYGLPQAATGPARMARIDRVNQILLDHEIDAVESFNNLTPNGAALLIDYIKGGHLQSWNMTQREAA